DFIDAVIPPGRRPALRLCIDLDASLRGLGGRIHLGPRRSPVHAPEDAGRLARLIAERPGFTLVGLMAYEGQVAGVGNRPAERPARCRPPCAAGPPGRCGSATGSGSGTPRPASWLSMWTSSTSCRTTGSTTARRPTEVRARPSSRPL